MSLTKLEHQELSQIIAMLSNRLELNKDLPEMVFRNSGLEFYFFERPLFCNVDVLYDLLCSSLRFFRLARLPCSVLRWPIFVMFLMGRIFRKVLRN